MRDSFLMILRFSECTLDLERRQLHRNGEEIHAEPQVFDLLAFMAQSGGAVVSKEALVDAIWNGLAVSDATIAARISAARSAVGDSGKEQAILRTIPRRGLAFVVDLETETRPAPPQHLPPPDVEYALSRDGSAIAWCTTGDGAPLLRIGHWLSHLELDARGCIWGPLIARLSQNRRLIRYDLRGTGLSDRDAPLTGIEDFVEDMAAVAEAAGLDRFDVFAASQAVPVAIRFAALHPGRIRRMVLVGGYVEGRVLRPVAPGSVDEDTMLAMIRAGWGKAGSPVMQGFTTVFAPDATREQRNELVEMQLATASPETAIRLRALIDRFDVRADLPKVDAPALIFHATGDAIQPISQGQKLAAHLKDAQFVRLEGGNHVMLPQDPAWQEMMDRTDAFLDS